MRSRMFFQIPPLGKSLGTQLTLVRLLSRMNSYMTLQCVLANERLLTVLALKRPLARMNHHMLLQVTEHSKLLRAHLTLE